MHDPTATPGTRTLASRSCLLLALLIAIAGCSTAPVALRVPPRPVSTGTPTPTPTPTSSGWQLSPGESLIAVAKHSSVDVWGRADGPVRWRLSNPNSSGARLVFLVLAQNGSGWNVRVPSRPNGAVGWVADTQIALEVNPYELHVSLSRHTLSVYDGGRRVRVFAIGVGRASAPTPTGTFFLTELLEAANPNGPYGAFAYGTSAFSDVYSEFEGGPGQIGVHGTNDPSSVGRNVSHGCIRLGKQDIRALAHMVPAGTPLTISP
jgi:lipoprotein-anchoring transpeptidase ErfK/SrfK